MPQPLPETACLHHTPGGLANSSIAGTLQHIMQVPQERPGTSRGASKRASPWVSPLTGACNGSAARPRPDHEAVVGILGDLPPQIFLVLEGHQAVVHLLEIGIAGGGLGVDLVR